MTEAVREPARICPRPFLSGLCRNVVQRLLAVAAEADAADGDGDDDGRERGAEDRVCSLLGRIGSAPS